jgi:hypothetical protein
VMGLFLMGPFVMGPFVMGPFVIVPIVMGSLCRCTFYVGWNRVHPIYIVRHAGIQEFPNLNLRSKGGTYNEK